MNNIEVPRTQQEVLADPFSIYPSNVFSPDSEAGGMKLGFPKGHTATDYAKWLTHKTGEIYPLKCVNTAVYEPYIVTQKCQHLPPPQDQFTTAHDKASWIAHLILSGYDFRALAGSFCIHLPHAKSGENFYDHRQRSKAKISAISAKKKAFYEFVKASTGNASSKFRECSVSKDLNKMIKEYLEILNKYHNGTRAITLRTTTMEKKKKKTQKAIGGKGSKQEYDKGAKGAANAPTKKKAKKKKVFM